MIACLRQAMPFHVSIIWHGITYAGCATALSNRQQELAFYAQASAATEAGDWEQAVPG